METTDKTKIFSENNEMTAGIDAEGRIMQYFNHPVQSPGGLFVICTKGSFQATIYMNDYTIKKNTITIVMPDVFFHIKEQSQDCRLEYIMFSKGLIQGTKYFTETIEFAPLFLEHPSFSLTDDIANYLHNYIDLQIQSLQIKNLANTDYIGIAYSLIISCLRNVFSQMPNDNAPQYSRNQEIVRELIRVIVHNYTRERNVTFYANELHLSPQHLSTTIKKVTGKTLTDIISSFIIHDAEAKLKSTGMTIQEIAYSLNFPDISFFGKYFKRYTGMSPKQYRNNG